MSRVSQVVIENDGDFDEEEVTTSGEVVEVESEGAVAPSASERERMRAAARRRIEMLREEAALKRALNDDIFSY